MFIKKELFIFLCINRQALLHLSREKIKSLLMFLRTKTCQNDFIYIYIYIYKPYDERITRVITSESVTKVITRTIFVNNLCR
jgi:hypothetical protein